MTPPSGEETYIAIGTHEKVDLSGLIDEQTLRGEVATRGGESPLQRLVKSAAAGKRGNAPQVDSSDNSWGASTATVQLRAR